MFLTYRLEGHDFLKISVALAIIVVHFLRSEGFWPHIEKHLKSQSGIFRKLHGNAQ